MKLKITLLLITGLFCYQSFAQIIAFKREITAQDVPGSIAVLDRADINNNPNYLLVAKKEKTITLTNGIRRDPNPISTGYDASIGRYYFKYNDPNVQLEVGSIFNVAYDIKDTPEFENGNFTHTASTETFPQNASMSRVSIMDYPLTNDDPTWRFLLGALFGVGEISHEEALKVYYDLFGTGEWVLMGKNGTTIPVGAEFNLLGNTDGFYRYEHVSTMDNIGKELNTATDFSFFTWLSHPFLDGNPDALVFLQYIIPTGNSEGFFFETSTYYDADVGLWQGHIELESFPGSSYNFPTGEYFNVFASNGTLDTKDNLLKNRIQVYPNPINRTFTVQASNIIDAITIYNLLGQKVKAIPGKNNKKLKIDLKNYQSGSYIVRIKVGDAYETIRLVKK